MYSDIEVGPDRCTLAYVDGGLLIAVNALLSVVGSLGNIFVCLTILLTPSLRVVSSYCIVNLALADLLVTMLVQPLFVAILAGKMNGECFVRAEYAARFIGNYSCSVSMLTLATMSVERCYAIVKPVKYKAVVTTRLMRSVLLVYWCSLSLTVPFIDAFVEDKFVYICYILSGIVVKFSIVIISYSVIFVTVKRHNSLKKSELQDYQAVSREKEKRLAKTIALVIGFFTLFWLPFVLLIAIKPNKNYGIAYISGVTASLANSAINPMIYFYRNNAFRQALKNILKGCFIKKQIYPDMKRQSFDTKL
ncbi:5-hydroxytryptamine receptor 7-like [Oculina patagonica]